MIAAEDKIRVIERILETDDTNLLRDIESLLHQPTLFDYQSEPMSQAAFITKIAQAEAVAQRGEVIAHEDVHKFCTY